MSTAIERLLVVSDGAALEVFASGQGPNVLVTTHPSQYAGADGGPLARTLASLGRGLVVNPRGTGGSSPWELEDTAISQLVDDLEGVRKALHRERWVVVGQSLGGVVALVYALRFPESVAGLVLSCTTARGVAEDPLSVYHPDNPDHAPVRDAIDAGRLSALRALVAYRPDLVTDEPGGGMSPSRHQAFVRELRDLALYGRLGDIAVPTLVVGGRHDRALPIHHSEELATGIPKARFHAFEESGHFPYLEEPGLYRSVLADFIAGLLGTSPV